MKILKVTAEEKELMQKHCAAIKSILDKYPWFEPDSMYVVTSMSRCKSSVEALERHLSWLQCEEI